jgi:hypothetical protein
VPRDYESTAPLQNSLPVTSGQRIDEKQRMGLLIQFSPQFAAFCQFAASSSQKNLPATVTIHLLSASE